MKIEEIQAKKSLGQNFLKDENILQKIKDSVKVTDKDLIIEIGLGMGALTKYLVNKGCDYLGYEIDERMRPYLANFASENKRIIFADFLKRDLKADISSIYQHIYVIANIPYYITTPIIEHIINNLDVNEMVLLVQKEVANRFTAVPGSSDYGYFTVLLNHYFVVEKLFDVSPTSFFPSPKVVSSVVKFTKKQSIWEVNIESFQKFVKQIFAQKRKTLKNNLKMYDFSIVLEILQEFHYSSTVRAEELSYEVILKLYQRLVLKH